MLRVDPSLYPEDVSGPRPVLLVTPDSQLKMDLHAEFELEARRCRYREHISTRLLYLLEKHRLLIKLLIFA